MMDSSHAPHHTSHGSQASIHLPATEGGDFESNTFGGESTKPTHFESAKATHFESNASTHSTQSTTASLSPNIELAERSKSNPTSPASSPSGYDYQSTTVTVSKSTTVNSSTVVVVGPIKRSSESKSSSSDFQSSKRIRLDPEHIAPHNHTSTSAPLSSPTSPSPANERTTESRRDRNTTPDRTTQRHATSASRTVRSKSLPPTPTNGRRSGGTRSSKHGGRNSATDAHNLPPVTLTTLRELDLSEIYRNPKLRHDVVFDAQLHFRPNLDGSRGKRKREQAENYWKNVLLECEELFKPKTTPNSPRMVGWVAQKLPQLFKTMKDILSTLVPKSDREEVEAALENDLLMQQLQHGVLDFKKLSEWLAGVLKAHCAPMRDQWVEQMVSRVAYGVDHNKTPALVEGLKMVFGILEAMKLDVANHQIRTLRPHLVSTAVQFEQGYFQERIESGRLDMAIPRKWFSENMKDGVDPYIAFTQATIQMLAPSTYQPTPAPTSSAYTTTPYPQTFQFDFERLDTIRDDIREATCLKLAVLFFQQLTFGRSKRDIDAATIEGLRTHVLAILHEEEGSARWTRGSAMVALHVAQAAYEFNGNTGIVDAVSVKLAEGWFATNLEFSSPVYTIVEQNLLKEIATSVLSIMKGWSSLSVSPIMQAADLTGSSVQLTSISQRIAHIAFLHWRIFGKLYISSS
ncbi:T-complex protein 11-domain-containing protein [Pyronema domesticum]|uniref:Similar to Protein SOK1 acc. no. P40317 n=1 Tax=Pyronema omphalodes (strain CBS 100304) TaxID=1076935 RepID=U4LLS2_PYROM|nr:T-complex protein 11-domain-containing protein [Pyronema domesticum]CCX33089.1 Similar to Protein SOK1; acc. no. P40317 [Pyronema omphalodes CBS 100304]